MHGRWYAHECEGNQDLGVINGLSWGHREVIPRYRAYLTVRSGRHITDDEVDDHDQKCGEARKGINLV